MAQPAAVASFFVGGTMQAAGIASALVMLLSAPDSATTSHLEVIQEVAVDSLSDVAMAEYREEGSLIYFNPTAIKILGPEVSAFLMEHERGHIHFKHTRSNALLAGRTTLDQVLQTRELAADCYAASTLGRNNREAVLEAVRFFGKMGSFSFDAAHPSGAQRAATILSCLPASP